MGILKWLFPAFLIGAFLVALSTFYTVRQDQQALVLRFGKAIDVRNQPGTDQAGLYFKLPWETAVIMDRKNLGIDVEGAFVRWQIADPLKFYQRLRTERAAASQINRVTESAIREALGTQPVKEIISGQRAILMNRIRTTVNANLAGDGIDIIDVRILQADLPAEVAAGVYGRMSSSRRQEAEGIRASGEEQARKTKAEAARDARVLVAQAREQSEIIKGEGDAKRNEIYAEAYNQDPDFFRFYRSLEACKKSITRGTRIVVSPDQLNLCRVFEEQAGAR